MAMEHNEVLMASVNVCRQVLDEVSMHLLCEFVTFLFFVEILQVTTEKCIELDQTATVTF